MSHLLARIIQLESIVRGGCDTCHDWTATALIDDDGIASRPEACPVCGREVPVEQWIELAGISLEAI